VFFLLHSLGAVADIELAIRSKGINDDIMVVSALLECFKCIFAYSGICKLI